MSNAFRLLAYISTIFDILDYRKIIYHLVMYNVPFIDK